MAEEATVEIPEIEEPEDNAVISDIDVPKLDDEEETDSNKDDDEAQKAAAADRDAQNDEFKSRFDKLEKELNESKNEIEKLNKGNAKLAYENRQLLKSQKDDDPESRLTPAQLAQIINENKDDTTILVHAINELIDQKAIDAQKLTDKKVETSKKQTQIDSLMEGWKDHIEQNRESLDKIIEYHDLGDHFAKDYLAAGAMLVANWKDVVEKIKDEAKKEALSGISEKNRKSNIKNNKPDTGGDETAISDDNTPTNWAETADRLGMNKKQRERYFALMKKSSKKKES